MDNQQYAGEHHSYECLLGAGALHRLECNAGEAFSQLKEFHIQHPDWIFGHLGYDLKNELFPLTSSHPDPTGFADMFFFVPELVIQLGRDAMHIGSYGEDHLKIFNEIVTESIEAPVPGISPFEVKQRFSREEYIGIIEQLRQHILRGDCYEINFCQQFYAEQAVISSVRTYQLLSELSPNPFAAFYKVDQRYLLCASPERYLRKEAQQLLSQPIKGTTPRDRNDQQLDEQYKAQLFNSAKDRSENVMVVDLVRNDLAIVCEEGSVKVDELFGIYSFPQVHQMISTVSGQLRSDLHWTDAIKATFPMGSMTGAPKRKVLELIEKYEAVKRGIFSGAVGYVTPDSDFDFNVVIRSILYNAADRYLSWLAGGGITFYSDPEMEYEESLLKAAAIQKVLNGLMPQQP
ncbi:anthranilate synthase component I family protein [Pseudoflavitalea sp. G-6-1-2]|uniref:anthranilate synthase component I family protein n=1 Tax=Pseudoflavitalea sp. G-6-1-2 TaxID=2728841 RepID=UPI001F0FC917|nr:anthranilate synthase component I family protein [Pseudoflavitalea sp. G-6-1-2]